jgi:Flp pilus assembly pilin Flp
LGRTLCPSTASFTNTFAGRAEGSKPMLKRIRQIEATVEDLFLRVWVYSDAAVHAREEGNVFVEYGLVIAVVALIALTAGRALGIEIRNTFVAATCFLRPGNTGCSGFGQ